MNYLFLMDPLETVIYEKDTSFILMVAAASRGHTVYYLPKNGVSRLNGKARFHVTQVEPQLNPEQPFLIQKNLTLTEEDVDVIFIRTDPPFDDHYLMHTWLLDLLPERIKIINSPSGIRSANEKVWASQFCNIIPETLISSNKEDLHNFLEQQNTIIIKPTDSFGGQGIFKLNAKDSNINVAFELLTKKYHKEIIAQKFIPEAKQGDKRILLLNGKPLGAVLRVHEENDHRNNFFSGGHEEKTSITENDKYIIETLKPYLQQLGLYFVGIDILGDYLIEVNVTSPTCLQEMMRLDGKDYHLNVIDFIDQL